MRDPSSESSKPKYQVLFDTLSEQILSGRFKAGDKLPSESALVKNFATSRITVGRALRELQHRGLIERVAGSGTYVREQQPAPLPALLFGLLIPDLGITEIFDPICHGIANAPAAGDHALLWGHSDARQASKTAQALALCRQYIARKVSGVFFAPLEFETDAEKTNRSILGAFGNAGIPVLLLDRRPAMASEPKRHDLVGLNNRHAGYSAAEHLIRQGARHLGFLASHGSPAIVAARLDGYEAALRDYDLPVIQALQEPVPSKGSPVSLDADIDGWVCVNDRVAGQLMHSLLAAGVRIPEEVRIAGIDDVPYASLLPVPLTTVRQPCAAIGEAALSMMLDRIRHPETPARELLLDGALVVRQSCGARSA